MEALHHCTASLQLQWNSHRLIPCYCGTTFGSKVRNPWSFKKNTPRCKQMSVVVSRRGKGNRLWILLRASLSQCNCVAVHQRILLHNLRCIVEIPSSWNTKGNFECCENTCNTERWLKCIWFEILCIHRQGKGEVQRSYARWAMKPLLTAILKPRRWKERQRAVKLLVLQWCRRVPTHQTEIFRRPSAQMPHGWLVLEERRKSKCEEGRMGNRDQMKCDLLFLSTICRVICSNDVSKAELALARLSQ